MADVEVTWVQGDQFIGSGSGGHSIVMDAPAGRTAWQGFKPSELLLVALGGCTGVDVVDILRKKRQRISGMQMRVHGEQDADPPWTFRRINVHYEVRGTGISEAAVRRAIELSEQKYCSVAATIGGVATLTSSYRIVEEHADAVAEEVGATR
jgi:putative redox protein